MAQIDTPFVTSHTKTLLKIYVRAAERAACERMRHRLTTRYTQMRSHGWMAKEKFCTDKMARMNGRTKKFLHGCGCTDAQLKKLFAQMKSHGWTAEENFSTDEVARMNSWRKLHDAINLINITFHNTENIWSRWRLLHHVSSQLKLNMSYNVHYLRS